MSQELNSGSFALNPLYDFAWEDRLGEALLQKSKKGRQFGRVVRDTVSNVPAVRGVYMWGRYGEQGRWINLYIGRSGAGKAHLHYRLTKELTGDRCVFWEPIFTKRQLQEFCRRNYPGHEDYVKSWNRALHRSRASRIVWVEIRDVPAQELGEIESELIEILNPSGNVQLPKPPKSKHDLTMRVIKQFRHEVFENRTA
jgi:hypothetical protein